MKKLLTFAFILCIYCPAVFSQNKFDDYEIDNGHTSIQFIVNRFGILDVVTSFTDVSGTIKFNADDVTTTKANIVINTSSLFSGNEQRENAIKSPAFLNVDRYPTIKFNSDGLKRFKDQWIANGDLTILETTNTIQLPVTINGPIKDPTGLTTIAIKGEITINRQDFGMAFNRKFANGSSIIGDSVRIQINALAIKSQ